MCRALPKREAGRFKGKGLGPAGLPALPAQFQPRSRHPNSLLKAGRGGRIRNCCDSTTTQPLSVMKRANLGNQEAVYKQPKIDVSFALTSLRRTTKCRSSPHPIHPCLASLAAGPASLQHLLTSALRIFGMHSVRGRLGSIWFPSLSTAG